MVIKNFLPLSLRRAKHKILHSNSRRKAVRIAALATSKTDDDDEEDEEKPRGKKKIKVKSDKGSTISLSEHEKALEKARRQERDKLHEQIAEAEKAARIAKRRNAKMQGALEALKEAKNADGETIDVEALLNKAHKKWTKLNKASGDDNSDVREELEELRAKLQKSETRDLRRRLIAEAGGEKSMIVEMVKGETEAEIEASIEQAQEALKKYIKGKKGKNSDDDEDDEDDDSDEDEDDDADDEADEDKDDDENKNEKGKRRKAPPEIPQSSGDRGGRSGRRGESKVLSSVKSMNSAEYAKARPKIMDTLRARYNGGGASPFKSRTSAGRR